MDQKSRCYLYAGDNNRISPAFLPIEDAVVRRDHIDQREERDERLEAYISRLNTDWTVDLSFERNLGEFFRANDIGQDVQKLVYKAIEHE
jgi:hypothetical protein